MKPNNKGVINQENLMSLLHYNKVTGVFTWRKRDASLFASAQAERMWNKRYAGKEAGTVRQEPGGYRVILINGRKYMAHRLAWMYEYGKIPEGCIDHINCNKLDNNISNLRECTMSENLMNSKLMRGTMSGIKGVHLHKPSGRWQARLRYDGKNRHVGSYGTKEEAKNAIIAKRNEVHGEFARHE